MSPKRPGQKPRKENYISDSDSDHEGKRITNPNIGQPCVSPVTYVIPVIPVTPVTTICPMPNSTIQPSYSDEMSMRTVNPTQPAVQNLTGGVGYPPGNYAECSAPPAVQVCPMPPVYPSPGADYRPDIYPTNPPNQSEIGFSSPVGYPPANPLPPSNWGTSSDIGFQSGDVGGYPMVNTNPNYYPSTQVYHNTDSNYTPGVPQPNYSGEMNYYQPGMTNYQPGTTNYQPGSTNYQPGVPRY